MGALTEAGGGADSERYRISDGLSVLFALQRALGGRHSDRTPAWAEFGFPVIDRGKYAIFPLAVAPAQVAAVGDGVGAGLLVEMADRLRRDCVHLFGGDFFHRELELAVEDGYGRKLVEAGAVVDGTPWECLWCIERFGVVLAHSVDRRQAQETLALHIVPKDWVHYRPFGPGTKREASRYRRAVRERDAADVVWSWPPRAAGG
ncbi:hypothetical protein ACIA8O_22200 [Kitasatospora sp. NPDC051853]|uniref:hypothetical protein n=1 Tax=Kitasatospora sp. NPDC051853 TaxID=3364058 RepID=UPI0037AEF4F7